MTAHDKSIEAFEAGGEGQEEGDLLLWILVWSEFAAFGVLLAAFILLSFLQQEAFAAGRAHLSPGLAAANTLILLTSGWQAARAARRRNEPARTRAPLLLAALTGFAFVAVKLYEYAGEAAHAGTVPGAFFELYFLITGFHLLHVLFGAILLGLVAWRPAPGNVHMLTTLWHAIDLIWLVMFPVIYLV